MKMFKGINANSHAVKKVKLSTSNTSNSSESIYGKDQTYCIFLHTVEGINFNTREIRDTDSHSSGRVREKVVMVTSLNGIKFNVEGNSACTSGITTFNSNCIWECDVEAIKQLKSDNKPVKLNFFSQSLSMERVSIGNLLLPLRGLPLINSVANIKIKMFWHKLCGLNNAWRNRKPEVYIMLCVIRKTLLQNMEFELLLLSNKKLPSCSALQSPERSLTGFMLQSQANVYVQQITQLGLLQVGNNAIVDCDIIEVILRLKKLKFVNKLIKSVMSRDELQTFNLVFDFVGSVTAVELKINDKDRYDLCEKLGLRFKTSLKSLRLYFQRIFYLPITMLYNDNAIANYRMDFGKLLPENSFFNEQLKYSRNGLFIFDYFSKNLISHDVNPTMEYAFTVEIISNYSRNNSSHTDLFLQYEDTAHTYNDVVDESSVEPSFLKESVLENFENLNSSNIERVEKLGHDEKVSIWCEEVIKSLQIITNEQVQQTDGCFNNESSKYNKCSKYIKTDECSVVQQKEICEDYVAGSKEDAINVVEVTISDKSGSEIKSKFSNVAVNTEHLGTHENSDFGEIHLNVVRELEEWKKQQMDLFTLELERKELEYIKTVGEQCSKNDNNLNTNIEKYWQLEQKIKNIQKTLAEKLNEKECEYNRKLLEKDREHENDLNRVKYEFQKNYQRKFSELESNIITLKTEMEDQLHQLELRNKELTTENAQLVKERMELLEHFNKMNAELEQFKKQESVQAIGIRDMLNELCIQNDRYLGMEKSKNFYKEQWHQCTRRMQRLQRKLRTEKEMCGESDSEMEFNVRDTISDDPDNTDDTIKTEDFDHNSSLNSSFISLSSPE